jgi:hypothetical protein
MANATMKAQTKAIRRAVLAHCSLGMMDETEVASIPDATTTILEVSPWEEPLEPEWSEEENRQALSILGDLDEALARGGFPEDSSKYKSTMDLYKSQKGTLPFEKWSNRVAAAIARIPVAQPAPPVPETLHEAFTAQQQMVREEQDARPISQATIDFVDALDERHPEPKEFLYGGVAGGSMVDEKVDIQSVRVPEEPAIDSDQYIALGILLEANGIDRAKMRLYCSKKGYLLPAKKPTLARLKVSEFQKFRDAIGSPNRRDIADKINSTTVPAKGKNKKEE